MKHFELFLIAIMLFLTIGFSTKASKVVDIMAASENQPRWKPQ